MPELEAVVLIKIGAGLSRELSRAIGTRFADHGVSVIEVHAVYGDVDIIAHVQGSETDIDRSVGFLMRHPLEWTLPGNPLGRPGAAASVDKRTKLPHSVEPYFLRSSSGSEPEVAEEIEAPESIDAFFFVHAETEELAESVESWIRGIPSAPAQDHRYQILFARTVQNRRRVLVRASAVNKRALDELAAGIQRGQHVTHTATMILWDWEAPSHDIDLLIGRRGKISETEAVIVAVWILQRQDGNGSVERKRLIGRLGFAPSTIRRALTEFPGLLQPGQKNGHAIPLQLTAVGVEEAERLYAKLTDPEEN